MVSHGLLERGEVDPNQGQLFNTSSYETPLSHLAAQHGVPAPLESSRGGWLPEIEPSPSGVKSASKRKIEAVTNFTRTREAALFPGSETSQETRPLSAQAHHMRGVTELRGRSPQTTRWYAEYGRSGLGPGEATEGIEKAAQRTGATPASMTRAIASRLGTISTYSRPVWRSANVLRVPGT